MSLNFDNWLCRCSALGKIITPSGKLTDGVKTHLEEVFISVKDGVQKEAYGKALEKGIACEDDGFKMLNEIFYPRQFVSKVKEPMENAFIKGTPDCIVPEAAGKRVTDIKNAYTRFAFGKMRKLPMDYYWQVKGYMLLHNLPLGRLFYCLNNMPDYMIADEERKLFYTARKWISMDDPDYLKACEELRAAHTYDNLPLEERFRFWDLERNAEDDERIIDAVKKARVYLNELAEEHRENVNKNRKIIEVAKA